MKKNYIKPSSILVNQGCETNVLLSCSEALTSQSLDFELDYTPLTNKWGFYTGNSYSVFDNEWGN